MKNLKNMVAAWLMVAVMSVATVFAGDGIIVGSRTAESSDPCTTESTESRDGIIVGSRDGIIVGSIVATTGIIVGSFTGIIVGSVVDDDNDTCGIIVGS
jgi:hypothetical protein